ncbi:hypothetical protein [Chondromyces crocatus]|uniref:Uncharacterized protein n=1 Tax=Chondromyces crocatus TaxID=52 RepID=A0A0K1EH29_CHOCO|nr:hypothetical protein [Chondromyces crocatus]AKT39903.1 uncharacterized protein CMC5_040540 [Chondromyces crocatus]
MSMRSHHHESGSRSARSRNALHLGGAALLFAGLVACEGKGKDTAPGEATSPSASVAPPAAVASSASASATSLAEIPLAPDVISKVVNPKNEAPYSGPTGTLKGRVTIKGSPPPETPHTYPVGKCGEAAATYGRLFRVGQDNTLADALVSVIGYSGYVPAKEKAAKITIHGCAFARRTVAATFGQRIEVSNLDVIESYMPYLDGARTHAVLVAIPRGDSVKLYPPQAGHYMLRDQMPKPFMTSDVFVLKYATHDVTELDGTYEISGIPVGNVTAVAYLPVLNDETQKEIVIKEGENKLDLELTFDLDKWNARQKKK